MHIYSKQKRGFTLIEMLMVVAITMLISAALFTAIVQFYRFNDYALAQAYQVSYARQGVEQLVRDLREMTFADDGTFPLVRMDDYEIGFYSDIDRDDSVEYVEYRLATTTFIKTVYGATGSPPVYSTSTSEIVYTLSEYVQNEIQTTPIFRYYDEAGDEATASSTLTDIRYVEVGVIVNIDPLRDPGQFMLRSSASLRNLKAYE